MSAFKEWNQELIRFQKRSRIAVLTIVILGLVVIASVKIFYATTRPLREAKVQVTPFEKEVIQRVQSKTVQKKKWNKKSRWEVKTPQVSFNPNNYTVEDWMNLGYSEKQAISVINFVNAGFEFKVKSDLKKLFIMDEESYAKLYNYIELPDTIRNKKQEFVQSNVEKKEVEKIGSINQISKEDLMGIKGVGNYYATKVLNFRDALGGFVHQQQLKEVYHLPDSIANQISRYITIDTSFVKRRNINEINLMELKQHPYISYKLANSIIAYRKTHGAYSSLEELKELVLMDAETFQKVRPYLMVE